MNINIESINAIGLGYGELSLKGKNRGTFERNIRNNIVSRLKKLDFETNFYYDMSKPFITFEKGRAKEVLDIIKNIFGINNLTLCICTEMEKEQFLENIKNVSEKLYENGARSFKVMVNRANKKLEQNSMDIAKKLGGYILKNTNFTEVKMKDQDLLLCVDLRDKAYIYTEKRRAYGGMPLGSSGTALSLLSGGIDSPVASFMMAKRGLKISYVTFHSFPFTSNKALEKIESLVKILSEYNGKSAFYKLNILKMQQAISKYTNKDYATILTRRCMMKLSNMIAKANGYKCLITGESLAQVASQTMGGLSCTNASSDLIVLRPLIGIDKIEIIEMARQIGTYEKSIEPHEDSCSLFAPKHPCTNPNLEQVLKEEAKIENYDEILEEIYKSREYVVVNQE